MLYSDGGPAAIKWKKDIPQRYDACYWKIHVPEYRWKSADINIKFSEK